MKQIHYRNIGMPKTGTTWLYYQLLNHPLIDGDVELNVKEYFPPTKELYIKKYEKYNISYNLHTHTFTCEFGDNHYIMPKNIHEIATHLTMIIRNPYEVLNSYANYNKNIDPNSQMDVYLQNFSNHSYRRFSNFREIFANWDECKIKVKYLLYDDLVSDNAQFFYEICDHLGIPRYIRKNNKPIFVTNKKFTLSFDNEEVIKYINDNISSVEERLQRDLSHWKK